MFTAILDRSAIGLSTLCILHCLALPIALVMAPSVSAFWFAEEQFHTMLLYVVLPTSVIALTLGCKQHKSRTTLMWGFAGLFILISAAALGHDWIGEAGEKLFTFIGAIMVMVSHVLNFRMCRSDQCEH